MKVIFLFCHNLEDKYNVVIKLVFPYLVNIFMFYRAVSYGNESLVHHLEVMNEMVRRDKNRPAVIIWSVANEPEITIPEAEYYFK